MTDQENTLSSGGHSLGEMLRAARESRGLELSAIGRQTAVRSDYLAALEEGRHQDLPEPVYVRNFVKLFASAVGLDPRAALEMYTAELRNLTGVPEAAATAPARPGRGTRQVKETTGAVPEAAVAAAVPRPRREPRRGPPGSGPAFGSWLPSLLLIIVVVGLAVWGFNSTLFRPGSPVTPVAEDTQVDTIQESAVQEDLPAAGDTVRLSVTTEPAGARVLVDAFPLEGLTPINSAPVTARESRLIRVELDGFEPFEAPFDLTFNRNLSFVLQEASEPQPEAGETELDAPGQTTAAQGTISVRVSDESWLEIYPGTAREGTPHVYTTASPGDEYSFDLPVYIRVGNAAGVSVSVSGRELGALGSAGEITARAFTLDD